MHLNYEYTQKKKKNEWIRGGCGWNKKKHEYTHIHTHTSHTHTQKNVRSDLFDLGRYKAGLRLFTLSVQVQLFAYPIGFWAKWSIVHCNIKVCVDKAMTAWLPSMLAPWSN